MIYFLLNKSVLLTLVSVVALASAALVCTNSQQPPSGAICNVSGHVRNVELNQEAASPFPAASIDICRDIALRRTYAYRGSFSWNSQTQVCRSFVPKVDGLDFEPDPSSPTTVSDGSCFSCRKVCPELVAQNVVSNGGFERSDSVVGPWKIRLATPRDAIISPGRNSSNALTIRSANGIAFQILRGMCTDTYYSVSFNYMVKTNSTPEQARILAGVEDAWNVQIPTSSVGWATVRDFFKVTPLSFPIVYTRITGSRGATRNFVVDDVSIEPLDRQLKPARGTRELITNGGFDTGRLEPFTTPSPRVSRVVPAEDDGFLLRLLSGKFYTLRQNITLERGGEYLLTFDYTAYNATDPGDFWSVWTNVDSRLFGPWTQYIEYITRQGPDQFVLPFVARQDATELSFNIQRSCGGFLCPEGFIFDIDNISVKRLRAG